MTLKDLAPQDRAEAIRAAIASAFDAREKGDRAAAEVNIMHAYHDGATALELAEAIEEHVRSRP